MHQRSHLIEKQYSQQFPLKPIRQLFKIYPLSRVCVGSWKFMNLGDVNKVWEIRTLKRMPKEEEARCILERVAKQVQPIMRNHRWRVKLLSEFCPKNASLLGVNVGGGVNIKLRLRRPNRNEEFIPFHEVLDTMLHELCHNAHGPHNASFYKLWDELRKECEDFINKGISGTGQGFDLPGKRLGGGIPKPFSSLRQVTLTAAENRARLGAMLPSGPKQIGGDSFIKASLSPSQAAAMAAEMRLRDNIWCGSEFCDGCEAEENLHPFPNSSNLEYSLETPVNIGFDGKNLKDLSRKRCHEPEDISLLHSSSGNRENTSTDFPNLYSEIRLLNPVKKFSNKTLSEECNSQTQIFSSDQKSDLVDITGNASPSISSLEPLTNDEYDMWPCTACTLMNPPLAPICKLCKTHKAKNHNQKFAVWLCKYCTLENDVKLEKCVACEAWRYSFGPPVAAPAPNLGT